jgi:transposase-like protein
VNPRWVRFRFPLRHESGSHFGFRQHKQDDVDAGRRDDGLTTDERKELTLLRRENKRLKLEAEILSKAAAWFARETNTVPTKSSDS